MTKERGRWVILIGFMGAGKDAVGERIAQKTGMPFISTDTFIELKENKNIPQIFQENGEAYFRKLEKETLRLLREIPQAVMATGGGMVLDEENRHILSQLGTVIHLDAPLEVLEKRLQGDTHRPLIQDKKKIKALFLERKGLYDFASLHVDTAFKSPEQVAKEIIEKLGLSLSSYQLREHQLMVKTSSRKYPVFIGSGWLSHQKNLPGIKGFSSKRVVLITNPFVGALYLEPLSKLLREHHLQVLPMMIPDGNQYKNLKTATKVYDFLLTHQVSRWEPIITLGGGVIGDLGGFVAATYKRGVPWLHLPTTLLAQVDASIGGKTGVDHPLGKNMIGVFYQPHGVVMDIQTLLTLPEREYRNGLAEVIKYAIIQDKAFFTWLQEKQKAILKRDLDTLQEMVFQCVQAKKAIVEKDEREEKGIRELLNFGHTIGHIIETLTGYTHYRHGETVAIGMVEEARIAFKQKILSKEALERMISLIEAFGLPTALPPGITPEIIKKHLLQDKKAKDQKLRLPILHGIGEVKVKEVAWNQLVS